MSAEHLHGEPSPKVRDLVLQTGESVGNAPFPAPRLCHVALEEAITVSNTVQET